MEWIGMNIYTSNDAHDNNRITVWTVIYKLSKRMNKFTDNIRFLAKTNYKTFLAMLETKYVIVLVAILQEILIKFTCVTNCRSI